MYKRQVTEDDDIGEDEKSRLDVGQISSVVSDKVSSVGSVVSDKVSSVGNTVSTGVNVSSCYIPS